VSDPGRSAGGSGARRSGGERSAEASKPIDRQKSAAGIGGTLARVEGPHGWQQGAPAVGARPRTGTAARAARRGAEGGSPLEALRPGTPSRTARGPTARWDRKEAAGKRPTRGTRNACQAAEGGQGSVGVRSPMASGTRRGRGGGDGRQVTRLTLGALSTCLRLGRPRDVPTGGQPSAAGEKERRSDPRPEPVNSARGHHRVYRRRRR